MTPNMQIIIERYPSHFMPLFTLGRNTFGLDFDKQTEFLKLGFSAEDAELLEQLVFCKEIDSIPYEEAYDSFYFAPLYAIYVLGQLQDDRIATALLESIDDRIDDDYFGPPLTHYFRHIGAKTLPLLKETFLNETLDPYSRMRILEVFEEIAEADGSVVPDIEAILLHYFSTDNVNDDALNGFALSALKKFTGAKHIGLIREVFATKDVDIGCAGDLEDFEIALGLRSERETIKPNPFLKYFDDSEFFDIPDSVQTVRTEPKIGRNDPCPCGSGKKYKKCCL